MNITTSFPDELDYHARDNERFDPRGHDTVSEAKLGLCCVGRAATGWYAPAAPKLLRQGNILIKVSNFFELSPYFQKYCQSVWNFFSADILTRSETYRQVSSIKIHSSNRWTDLSTLNIWSFRTVNVSATTVYIVNNSIHIGVAEKHFIEFLNLDEPSHCT